MKLEDMILVSVDDHAIEPAGAFDRHMPASFKGRQPHIEQHGGCSRSRPPVTWG